ncbi:HAD family hydrolase [Pseudomonas savastanoi]|uniref:HAD family hydrolase n=1 Tax=Pseudomonas savastanoi TaxID=29438 RepID=UPI000F00B173|nr:HAD family hydrolase [Pseudomonas savastanoi]RML88194.1 Haloacid dehalogenase-like family hydrolase [Pseudomonas savastanoi pv. glycinea]
MTYQAVIFDAFGTILHIRSEARPYRQLLREAIKHGRRPRADDAQQIMTFNGGLSACADHLEIQIQAHRLLEIEAALDEELNAIEAFPDALEAIRILQQHQLRIGICSNLAQPYGRAVRKCFPTMEAYTFSYEIGAIKPDPLMYSTACIAIGLKPAQVLGSQEVVMIGDSLRCDCHGPRQVGMVGVHLDRSASGGVTNLMDFAQLVLGAGE